MCSFPISKQRKLKVFTYIKKRFGTLFKTLMRSVQSYKHYIYARCCPTGQVGRWNLIVARGMLKPVYFAFETILEFIANYTFVKSRAHSARPTSKIIAIMIALRRAILMKVDPAVSLHAHRLFGGRACSCKKYPCF